ncbi:hypothetical protein FALBO_8438 [Fusarium albosuccineum]|uniref:Uncharacterized protein n=1 Tax=Fusarium albosuccineum TaxID=1237068 RepID=A0A8H4L9H9_9HYPO|nr:hypothetical protein FALBO_8438 [Fusarium albosuccineum]
MRRGNDDEPAPHHIVSRWLQTRRMCVDEDNEKAGTDGGEQSGSGEAPFLETREGGEELRTRMRADAPWAIMVSVSLRVEWLRLRATIRPQAAAFSKKERKNGDTGLLALALDSWHTRTSIKVHSRARHCSIGGKAESALTTWRDAENSSTAAPWRKSSHAPASTLYAGMSGCLPRPQASRASCAAAGVANATPCFPSIGFLAPVAPLLPHVASSLLLDPVP